MIGSDGLMPLIPGHCRQEMTHRGVRVPDGPRVDLSPNQGSPYLLHLIPDNLRRERVGLITFHSHNELSRQLHYSDLFLALDDLSSFKACFLSTIITLEWLGWEEWAMRLIPCSRCRLTIGSGFVKSPSYLSERYRACHAYVLYVSQTFSFRAETLNWSPTLVVDRDRVRSCIIC